MEFWELKSMNPVIILFSVYTTQVNSTLPWLASLEVTSQVLFTFQQLKKNKMAFVYILSQVTLCSASYSAYVVYTKTVIHFSVNEKVG